MILLGFGEKSDVQTRKANRFKHTLMSSEGKERQVGFDLRDEAHPSRTHGIRSCVSFMGKGSRTETVAEPAILVHREESSLEKRAKNSPKGWESVHWRDLPERLPGSAVYSPTENSCSCSAACAGPLC